MDITQDVSTIDSITDSELESDKQETADVDNSDYEPANVPPDYPPVRWETMMTDMRRHQYRQSPQKRPGHNYRFGWPKRTKIKN